MLVEHNISLLLRDWRGFGATAGTYRSHNSSNSSKWVKSDFEKDNSYLPDGEANLVNLEFLPG